LGTLYNAYKIYICLIPLRAYNTYAYVSVQTLYIFRYIQNLCLRYDICMYVCMHVRMRVYVYVCLSVCNLCIYIPEGRLSGRLAHRHVQQTVMPRWTNCPATKITELKAARYLCAVRAEHFAWKNQNDEQPRF